MSVGASPVAPLPASPLPVVNQTLEPAWVRHGSAATQKAYQSALAFEEMLVEQLSKSLTATSGLEDESAQSGESSSEGGGAGAGASQLTSSMLPQALTNGVMNAGGLGLAAQMTRELQDGGGATNAATTIGAEAATTGGSLASGAGNIGATGGASAGGATSS